MSNAEKSFRPNVPAASEKTNLPQQGDAGTNSHSLAQRPIGFVGMGHMGAAMATNLAATGAQVVAYVVALSRWTNSRRSASSPQQTSPIFSTVRSLSPCSRTTTPFAK